MTFPEYRRLVLGLRDLGRELSTVANAVAAGINRTGGVILRHDVDRRPEKAESLAQMEAELGMAATYYFRCRRGRFPEACIRRVRRFGHEVGYHYETLSDARGDRSAALSAFSNNLEKLRELGPVHTVAMHGAPLSVYDNGELLRGGLWKRFDLVGDARLTFEGSGVLYITDTGGRWNAGDASNMRDRIAGIEQPVFDDGGSVEQIIRLARADQRTLYITTHPERWADGRRDALYCLLFDLAAGASKRVIRRLRDGA